MYASLHRDKSQQPHMFNTWKSEIKSPPCFLQCPIPSVLDPIEVTTTLHAVTYHSLAYHVIQKAFRIFSTDIRTFRSETADNNIHHSQLFQKMFLWRHGDSILCFSHHLAFSHLPGPTIPSARSVRFHHTTFHGIEMLSCRNRNQLNKSEIYHHCAMGKRKMTYLIHATE